MLQEARPPYVRFEVQQKENRTASLAEGHYVSQDVVMVLVTQIGSSDTYINEAEPWLAHMRAEARAEPPRVPMEWVKNWQERLEDFKKSATNEVDGTSLRSWPMISKGQIESLNRVACFTVEDLAELNEEGIAAIGMGGRDLKKKAQKWLEESTTKGKVIQENVKLAEQLKQLQERTESLEEQNKLLVAERTAAQPKK